MTKKKILFVDENPEYGLGEILKKLSEEYEIESNLKCYLKEEKWKYWEMMYSEFHEAISTLACGDYMLRHHALITSLPWKHELKEVFHPDKTLRKRYGAEEHGGIIDRLKWMKSKLPDFPVIIYSSCPDFALPGMRALFLREGGVEAIIRKTPDLWRGGRWKIDLRRIGRALNSRLNNPLKKS